MPSQGIARLTRRQLAARLLAAGLLTAAAAPAQAQVPEACGQPRTAIAWTQPPQMDIEDPESTRWPIDATLRIAYGGNRCPAPEEFTLTAADGAPVPAQVRLIIPQVVVAHDELPPTLVEIDPVEHLAPRAEYTLTWRAPDPRLAAFEAYTLPFKTLARRMNPVPEDSFEGIQSITGPDGPCGVEGNPADLPPETTPAGCAVEARLIAVVRYRAAEDRPDLAYVIERVSSAPLDANGAPDEARTDRTVVPLVFHPGGREAVWPVGPRQARLYLPASPMPRQDCFRVRMRDEWGRLRGDETAIACLTLPMDLPCARAPASEAPVAPATPLRDCANVGLYGADPDRPAPPVGAEPPVLDGDLSTQPAEGCTAAPGRSPSTPWAVWALALLAVVLPRRHRTPPR